MHAFLIVFLLIVSSLFSLTTREERRARFAARSRQKVVETLPSALDQLNGLFFFGNFGGGALQSSDSSYTYDRQGPFEADIHFDGRGPLDIVLQGGIGWLFYGYASLDASYQYGKLPFSAYIYPTNGSAGTTQQGYGNAEAQLATLGAKLLLPKIFGRKEAKVIPFIGGGGGYVYKKLNPISLYDHGFEGRQDTTQKHTEGGIAYKILVGTYVFLQEHLLMNVECQYLNMGRVKAGQTFQADERGASVGEFSFNNPLTLKLRSLTFSFGFTIVI